MPRNIVLASKSTRLQVSLMNGDCDLSISSNNTTLLFEQLNNFAISSIHLKLSSADLGEIHSIKSACFTGGRVSSVRIDALFPTVFGADCVVASSNDLLASDGRQQFDLLVQLSVAGNVYNPYLTRIDSVSLIVGESTVGASKEVLGLSSDVLFVLFYGDYMEKNSGSYSIKEVDEKSFIWLIDSLMRRRWKVNSVAQALDEMSLADRFCMQIVHVRLLQYLKSVKRRPPPSYLKNYVDLAARCRDNGELLGWLFEKCRSSADLAELIREVGPTLTAPHLTTFFQFLATKQSDEKRKSEEEKARTEEEKARNEEKMKRSEEERNSLVKEIARLQQSSVVVVPSTATYPASGGKSTHTLINSGNCKIMYQTGSTNWKEYKAHSGIGFIEAGKAARLDITRKPGPAKADLFVIQYMTAPEGATDVREAFRGKSHTGEVKLSVKAE